MQESSAQFQINGSPTGESFFNFCDWAFSNMEVPFLRGIAIEYLLVRHLIKHADLIAKARVQAVTSEEPEAGALSASAEKNFRRQMHGDVFDLQLHWGVTFEFKTTASKESWRLHRTRRWSAYTGRPVKEWIYPSQFYVLAELDRETIKGDATTLNFGSVKFYARSGRSLDEYKTESVSYEQFTDRICSCSFEQLPQVLSELVAEEYSLVEKKFKDGLRWSTGSFDSSNDESQLIPFFLDGKNGSRTGWFQANGTGWDLIRPLMTNPWKKGVEIGWRDWETIGLKYDNSYAKEGLE